MCRLKFCRDLKARIAMRARWVLQNRSRRRGNRMRKGGENKVGQSFWYWWFGESGERGGGQRVVRKRVYLARVRKDWDGMGWDRGWCHQEAIYERWQLSWRDPVVALRWSGAGWWGHVVTGTAICHDLLQVCDTRSYPARHITAGRTLTTWFF